MSTHPLGHNGACNGDTLAFFTFYVTYRIERSFAAFLTLAEVVLASHLSMRKTVSG